MINAIVIDDEKSSRETLIGLVENYCPEINLVADGDSAETGSELVKAHKPDLIFLDVELPLGSGFDLLEAGGQAAFDVIFTTAHDQYALRAIKVCALDYLLKPISVSDLKAAVAKVGRKEGRGATQTQLGAFLENINNLNNQFSKIVLPTLDGFIVTQILDVIRCEADKNYTTVMLASGEKIMVSKTLKEYEELLHDFDFLRVHQSHLINAAHVQRYIKGSGGYVKMSDDAIIEVSRRKKEQLVQRFLKT